MSVNKRFGKILILSLLLLGAIGCDESEVMHSLSEREANALITRLGDADIHAEKILQGKDRWSVQVARNDSTRAIKIISKVRNLVDEGKPQEQGGLFLSKEDRKYQLAKSLARDIERTLIVLPGVHDAKVHLNFPSRSLLLAGLTDNINEPKDQAAGGSGSALLIVEDLSAFDKKEVARLVGGASGIDANHISVWLSVDKVGQLGTDNLRDGVTLNEGLPSEGDEKKSSLRANSEIQSQFQIILAYVLSNINIIVGVSLLLISILTLSMVRNSKRSLVSKKIPDYVP
jgi:hypothetical protein